MWHMSVNIEDILNHKDGVEANVLTKTINVESFEIQYPGAKTKYYMILMPPVTSC